MPQYDEPGKFASAEAGRANVLLQYDDRRDAFSVAIYAYNDENRLVPVAEHLLLLRLDTAQDALAPATLDDHTFALPVGSQITLTAADGVLPKMRVTAALIALVPSPDGVTFRVLVNDYHPPSYCKS